ncbi:hypothetical protein LSM04_005525 [Trypanosoma melophagium]|uniref:uncharacterized protein n=1 Tax=Trypanosoma melophagium TaxID=715481 RepID=UPI00351A29C0|nr:hypothetical protein LSM04_005525 [Trypanosoma melophagium]
MADVYYDGNDGDDFNRVVDRLTPDPLPPPPRDFTWEYNVCCVSHLEENRSFVSPHCDDCTSPAVIVNKELDEGTPITSAVTVTATSDSSYVSNVLKNASALVDVIWEESNGRQVLVMDQINDIGAILQGEEMFRNALLMSKESKNLLNALKDTSTLLCQTSEVAQQLLQWEMEENKKVSSNEISEIDKI